MFPGGGSLKTMTPRSPPSNSFLSWSYVMISIVQPLSVLKSDGKGLRCFSEVKRPLGQSFLIASCKEPDSETSWAVEQRRMWFGKDENFPFRIPEHHSGAVSGQIVHAITGTVAKVLPTAFGAMKRTVRISGSVQAFA